MNPAPEPSPVTGGTPAPVCVISGASGGIGRCAAIAFAQRGYRTVLLARRKDALASVVAECGGKSRAIVCDVSDAASVEQAVGSIVEQEGRCDVLVNNAGVGARMYVGDAGWVETLDRLLQVNVVGAARLTVGLIPALKAAASPVVVNVSSVAGRIATPNSPAYCTTKFALTGLSESMSAAANVNGFRVVNVQPGPIETPGWPHEKLLASRISRWIIAPPERVAAAIVRSALHPQRSNRYVPWYWRPLVIANAAAPELAQRFSSRIKEL